MIFRVIIEEQASLDIAEYGRWILTHGSEAGADRWIAGIEIAIGKLANMPKRCSLAPESAAFDREIRQLIYQSHRVLFTVEATSVHVLHVRHGARLPLTPDASEDD